MHLLGALRVERDGVPQRLPPSRKARALLAYLALAPRALTREALCALLWDAPADPRGELRSALSKLRAQVDEPGRPRLHSDGEHVRLDLDDDEVDVRDIDRRVRAGLDTLDAPALRTLIARLDEGGFLAGFEIDRSPAFDAWLVAQRRRLRGLHVAALEHLVAALPLGDDEALAACGAWLQRAPFDRHAHERLLATLAARADWAAGDEHVARAVRLFESEGQDAAALVHAWRGARSTRGATGAVGGDRPAPTDTRTSSGETRQAVARTSATAAASAAPSSHAEGLAVDRPRPSTDDAASAAGLRRASIAVMPFVEPGVDGGAVGGVGLGRALAHDVTMRLARLRSLFVIAQGSALALDARGLGADEAARALGVQYVASGTLQRRGERLALDVQLVETRTARIVWADVLEAEARDALDVLDRLGNQIVAELAHQVEASESHLALLKAPEHLDAWEAHHRGLWHMYRFDRVQNMRARHFFEQAIALDPGFARPYAGLSFTHFQDAFLGWEDRAASVERAHRAAAQAVMVDETDPVARWALGRAQWLRARQDDALTELEAAVRLSPNFSQGHYTLAFVHAQSGEGAIAIDAADHARALSPYDPMLFAMHGARAMALMRLGRHDEAAAWAMQGAARPNAHAHVQAIAAHCLALAQRADEAHAQAQVVRAAHPGYGVAEFLGAFRFDATGEAMVRRAAAQIGW